MPKRNRKGRFIKGGGHSRALTRTRTRTIVRTRTRHVKAKRRHRRAAHHSMTNRIVPIAIAAAAMTYALGPKGNATLKDAVNKIPGAKSFGAPAALGVAALAIDRFVKPNKYLKLLGVAGIVLAASKIGEQGTDFKWVGDDDMGDYDLADDVEGDDDTGDVGDDE